MAEVRSVDALGPPSMSLAAIVEGSYWRYADNPAIVERGRRTTYAELGQRVPKLSHAFHSFGLAPRDRVVIFLDNSPKFLETGQALFVTGFVRVALNTRLNPREVVQIVNDCEARLIVTEAVKVAELSNLRTEMPSVLALVAVGARRGEAVISYEEVLQSGSARPPTVSAPGSDAVAALMYTS